MQFTDHFFILYFFPIFLLIYLAARSRHRFQNILIIIFSVLFYASFGIVNIPILVIPVVFDFFIGIYLERQSSPLYRKIILSTAITVYLLILAYFKYALFVTHTIQAINPHSHSLANLESFFSTLIIPVGISFITFQRISYIFDIYRRKIAASRHFLQYATYELLFPHLISGPIVRFSVIKDQLGKRIVDSSALFDGMKYFIIGLALKVLVADQLFSVETVLKQNLSGMHFFEAISIIFYFSFRIYTDFCGYSLIAIGLAKLMGFDFPHNFNAPYQSESITQFWRRWNMTLSSWIRDYVYIPLGGNRKGQTRTYVNLMITMLLAGLWHGASWNFVIWGGLHGAYLTIERFCSDVKFTLPIPHALKRWATFLLVSFTWLTFIFTKPSDIFTVLHALVSFRFAPLNSVELHMILVTIVSLTAAIVWSFVLREDLIDKVKPSIPVSIALITVFSYSLYMTFWYGGVPFIYFQF